MSNDGPETGGRYALLIATGLYEDVALRRLRSPAKDAEELTDVLEDPAVGGYDVQQLLDQPDYVARVQIEGFFADARPDDLLLLYLSCHGVKDQAGQLYFAAANTRANRLASTGVSAEFVHQQVERCRSRRIVLLLDCCYSGAYARGYRPRGHDDADLGPLGGRGWAVITSATALEYAFEIDSGKVSLKKATRKIAPSLFTSAIVEGLRTGAADLNQDGLISFDELYTYVWTSIRQRTPHQTPEKKWGDVRGDIIIARNPHPAPAEKPGQAGPRDGTLIRISRRQAVLGLAAVAATTGIGVTGWEVMQGGSGTQIWQFTTSAGLAVTPRVVDGVVYADNGDSVYALRASDGGRIWEYQSGGGEYGIAVTSAAVYGGNPGFVYALRASDGYALWKTDVSSTGALAVTGGVLCVADLAGNVHGLRTLGGTPAWVVNVGARVIQGPVIVGSTVYVCGSDGKVHALHAGSGATVWKAAIGTGDIVSLAVTGGVVYSGSGDGYLYALHAGSGRHLWRLFTSGAPNLVAAGGVAYLCGAGSVRAVDVSDGKGLWESAAGYPAQSYPTVSGRTVYRASYNHDLYALRAANGRQLWKFRAGGYVTAAAVAGGGCVYFGSYDHNLYAVRASDGAKVWSFPTHAQILASPALVNGVVYVSSQDGNIYAVRA
jgi:outer membrane protein assembly factor BamB